MGGVDEGRDGVKDGVCVGEREVETECVCLCVRDVDLHPLVRIV